MDTIMSLTIYSSGDDAVMDEAIALIQRMDALFSVTNTESDIAKLNAAGGKPVTVSEETYELVKKCIAVSEETDGLFDISIYPLVKAWGFTTDEQHVPSEKDRLAAMKKINYKKIQLLSNYQIQLAKDMEIDLGAAAKGYLSQKLMELFQERGVKSAIVSLGGNVQTIGTKEDGSLFQVGITDPSDGTSIYGTLSVENKAVITSGIYQRYFTENGKTYHHIMDKRTGMPAENDLASVTVIGEDGGTADALATALYVMGEETAEEYQKNHPGIQLILIRKDGSCWQSSGAGMTQ
jgi:thiamine biosynthesis lipoprotein